MTVVVDQSHTRFLSIRHDTDVEAWRATLAVKSEQQRHFLALEQAAKAPAKVQPKPRRRSTAGRVSQPRTPGVHEAHLAPCTVCGTLTRPDSVAAKAAHPDLPRRRTKGMCATCFNAHRRKPTPPKIRECDQCGTPTRPARTPRTQYPGTRARQNGDTCQACYKRERRRNAA